MTNTMQQDSVERVAQAIYAVRPFVMVSTATTFGHQLAQSFDWDGAPAYYQSDMLDLARAAIAAMPQDEIVGELVARLTSYTDAFPDAPTTEAADRILALETRIRELEEALPTLERESGAA